MLPGELQQLHHRNRKLYGGDLQAWSMDWLPTLTNLSRYIVLSTATIDDKVDAPKAVTGKRVQVTQPPMTALAHLFAG